MLQDAVEDVIEHMDEYYLSREDWDTIVELGVGPNQDDAILKKINTATKTLENDGFLCTRWNLLSVTLIGIQSDPDRFYRYSLALERDLASFVGQAELGQSCQCGCS